MARHGNAPGLGVLDPRKYNLYYTKIVIFNIVINEIRNIQSVFGGSEERRKIDKVT